jgi:hypothetical protein
MNSDIKPGDSVRLLADGVAYRSPGDSLWIVKMGQEGDDDFGDYESWVDPKELYPMDFGPENLRALYELGEWLVSLDDPIGPGFEARRTVTLNAIIQRARAALGREEGAYGD